MTEYMDNSLCTLLQTFIHAIKKNTRMFFNKKSYSLQKFNREKTSNPDRYNTSSDKCNSQSKDITHQTKSTIFKPYLGLFYMLLHSTFYQFTSVIFKRLNYINPNQHSLVRNISIFVAILPVTLYHERQIFGERKYRLLLFIRAFFGAISSYFGVMAYSYLPLAEASIIMSSTPVVTALTAYVILKESYGLIQRVTLIMSVCGIILALKVPEMLLNRDYVVFDSLYIAGLVASIGYVLLRSLTSVLIRKLKKVHFSIVLLYFGFVGCIENAFLAGTFLPFVQPECGLDQILVILIGVCGFLSNMFYPTSTQVQPAGLSSVQKSSLDILIVTVFQILFFNIYPDTYVICGACIIIVSLFILGIRNWILILPETSQIRKKSKWLLK